jgi:hypothetical protein
MAAPTHRYPVAELATIRSLTHTIVAIHGDTCRAVRSDQIGDCDCGNVRFALRRLPKVRGR